MVGWKSACATNQHAMVVNRGRKGGWNEWRKCLGCGTTARRGCGSIQRGQMREATHVGIVHHRRTRRLKAHETEAVCGAVSMGIVLTSAAPVLQAWGGRTVASDGEKDETDGAMAWKVANVISLVPLLSWWAWIVIGSKSATHKERRFVYAACYAVPLVLSWYGGENSPAIYAYLLSALHFQVERKANNVALSLAQGKKHDNTDLLALDSARSLDASTPSEEILTSTSTLDNLVREIEENKWVASTEELRSWDERYELRKLRVPELRKLAKARGATVALSRLRKKELIDLLEELM